MGNSNGKPVVLTDEVNLNHFRLLRVVGKGAFGKVRIVERKDTGLTFALKYIRKDEVVRSESVRNIIRERRMLEHLNHPFLCNLRYSFQDMEYLPVEFMHLILIAILSSYIVVDLMNGGDLRFHISRKTFTEDAVRFWIAELGCALRYIHKQGIVHRDVKPDNILLDSEGHVHLADFNVASDFIPTKNLTSKSGTLAYLAPEVYAGKGYLDEVDWWSLGVVFYECIYNKRPFEANNHEALAQAIMKAEVPYPPTAPAVSMPCLHAISSLLEKNKAFRIGAAGFSTFADNPFFRGIDFEALERKEVEPVFCPSSDKTNFDATYDLEELLLEEAPLEARARKQKPRAELREDATKQEIRAEELHRMIETMFEPFNYTIAPQERIPVATATLAAHQGVAATAAAAAASSSSSTPQKSPIEKDASVDAALHPSRSEHSRPVPAPRSPTPGSISRTRSSTQSPDGSPPLMAAALASDFYPGPTSHPSEFSTPPTSNPSPKPSIANGPDLKDLPRAQTARANEDASPVSSPSGPSARPPQRPRGAARSKSTGGSASIVINSQGNWADLANQSAHPPPTSGDVRLADRPSGMLGFLNRKKGRDRSPKGKERERGVLGKEGARVILSHG